MNCKQPIKGYFIASLIVGFLYDANAKVIVEFPKTSPKREAVVKVVGEIKYGEDEELKSELQRVAMNEYKLKMNSVFFDTKGGNTNAAQLMGKLIRKQKLFTYIAPNASCASACIYAFSGGVVRMAYGRVSVHRSTFTDKYPTENIEDAIKATDERTRAYIYEMGLSSLLTDAILTTPNWAYRDLDDKDKRRWDVHGMERIYEAQWFRRAASKARVKLDDFVKIYVENLDTCNLRAKQQVQTVLDCVENAALATKKIRR